MAVNSASVAEALFRRLRDYPDLQDVRASREDDLNTDPSLTPWVGVYKLRQRIDPSTIARGWAGRAVEVDLMVICQYSDGSSGANASDGLESIVERVLDAIMADDSLGVGQVTRNLQVQYADVRREADWYFQEAAILLTLVI